MEQVGNADSSVQTLEDLAPESTEVQQDNVGDDFFAALDTSVNSGIMENNQELLTSEIEGSNMPEMSNSQVQNTPQGEYTEDVDALKKRYSDSSREGQRLNEKLKSLKPYMPILDAMRKDPNLIRHVRSYFEGGGQTPTNMKERLKLDEDFVFDADEAMSTPDSDSAKVLTATVDNIVQKRLSENMNQQKAVNQQAAQENTFKDKYQMDDTQWTEFVDFAKNRQLTLEDIYYLKNKEKRESNIASNAREQVSGQMKKVQMTPPSLATEGSSQVDVSQDDKVFNAMLGIDRELETAFG